MNKFNKFKKDLSGLYTDDVPINLSPSLSYRSRCEFGYYKNCYTMKDNFKTVYLKTFPDACMPIQQIMPKLLNKINSSETVKFKLFQINFRANSKNKILTTLIYHTKISELLIETISSISQSLDIDIIIRSKNFIHSVNQNYLEDTLEPTNLKIFQTDNCFYQPNKFLLNKMISKVIEFIDNPNDLIELYCGVGTFTLPLSRIFKNVFATENNRNAYKCLLNAIEINNIKNIHAARLSSDEVAQLDTGRKFFRMSNISIDTFDFSHILIDPPRSGLTQNVINIISKYKNIIYISCNPETYMKDIKLLNHHKIKKIELFDQFPNTQHLEIVSLLQKS